MFSFTTPDKRNNETQTGKNASGAHVAINTARPPRYCDEPSQTLHIAAKADHHCYDGASWMLRNFFVDVPASKVHNMGAIMRNGGVARLALWFSMLGEVGGGCTTSKGERTGAHTSAYPVVYTLSLSVD